MILENDIIIKTILMLAVMIAIISFNLWFFVRRGWSALSTLFHISSFLGLMGIFCIMMDIAILGLPFEQHFRQVGTIFLIVCFVVQVFALFAFFLTRKRGYRSFHLSPDLKSVFTSMDDLALILDHKGIIVEINHPQKLRALLGNCKTLDDIFAKLRQKTPESSLDDLETWILKIDGKNQLEVHIDPEDEDYLFSISPIVSGENCLGCTVVMQDITEIKRSENQTKANNRHLEEANEKLANYVKIDSVLEAEKERLSLLEQVQIDLIDKIENTIAHMRSIQSVSYDNIEAYRKETLKVSDMLRAAYRDLRKSISQISSGERG